MLEELARSNSPKRLLWTSEPPAPPPPSTFCLISRQKVDLTKYLEETIFNFDFAFDEKTNNEQVTVVMMKIY